MESHENLYQKIREILGGSPGTLKVLEQQIDMDLQVEYYDCSRRMREETNEEWAMENSRYLNEPGYSEEVKKEILARLASVGQVECYRAIESFAENAEETLRDWALLALNESRMHLESRILEENQVFISTGLGGKGDKLRYFVVLVARENHDITRTQQKVVRIEFEDALKRFGAELEELRFSGSLATLLLLLPMERSLQEVFRSAITECNKFGDFLTEDFIVTNVRTLSFEEIRDHLKRKGKKD